MKQTICIKNTDLQVLEDTLIDDLFAPINIVDKSDAYTAGFMFITLEPCTPNDLFLMGGWMATLKAKNILAS